MAGIRQAILELSMRGHKLEFTKKVRGLLAMLGKALLGGRFREMVEGIAATREMHARESRGWVGGEALAGGLGGPFDACDLRCWLALAARAGVPAVPATVILALTEKEADEASGQATLPAGRVMDRIVSALRALAGPGHTAAPQGSAADLREKLACAMDAVPEGWMVRHVRAGPSNLKSLAGCGLVGDTSPDVRFGPDLEVGPGWVRIGNRRLVDARDPRIVTCQAEGPDGADSVFVARPWVKASKWTQGEDIHRSGSPFAGPGVWPAEWRAFAVGGRIVGVSYYYAWAGGLPDPDGAAAALEVRRLAALVVDEAVRQAAWPRYMDLEFARKAATAKGVDLTGFGREDVSCTLDFIETADGLVLLEGGPANTPYGGGHPCAFAGKGGPPLMGTPTPTSGVAFRTLRHVDLGRPATWTDGDDTDCILSWDEVERLAATRIPAAA